MLNNLLQNLQILNEEQLKVASKEQLSIIFNNIHKIKADLDQQNMNAKIQLETKQNEFNMLLANIKENFGVSSIEELRNLKNIKITELANLGLQLQSNLAGGEVNNES